MGPEVDILIVVTRATVEIMIREVVDIIGIKTVVEVIETGKEIEIGIEKEIGTETVIVIETVIEIETGHLMANEAEDQQGIT